MLVGGLLVGVLIGYLVRMVQRPVVSDDKSAMELDQARSEIARFQTEMERVQKEGSKDRDQLMEVNAQKATLQANLDHLNEKLNNQKEEDQTKEQHQLKIFNIEHDHALLAEKKLVYVINEYLNGQAK